MHLTAAATPRHLKAEVVATPHGGHTSAIRLSHCWAGPAGACWTHH